MEKISSITSKSQPAATATFRSYAELYAEGKSLRQKCHRTSHAEWKPFQNRPDPLLLLKKSSEGRIPELLPIRYGRMMQSRARSGEPARISGYMGKTDAFDEAIADFSLAYADQSERDHDMLKKAVRAGKLEVATEAA